MSTPPSHDPRSRVDAAKQSAGSVRRIATSVVVVAAGAGRRIGAERNKILLPLAGEPLLAHTLRHLAAPGLVDEIVLVCREAEEAEIRSIAASITGLPSLRYARGGAERADSVRNGVAAATATDRVLIHDAARPFVGRELLTKLLESIEPTRGVDAVIPALPVTDTIQRVRDGRIVETLDRTELTGAQTPQAFHPVALRDAQQRAPRALAFTDDAALFLHLGLPVRVIPGDPLNAKVTTPQDLALAPAMLALFRARESATETSP